MTREDFIDLAGGVYENSNYYRSWTGSDKRENFWDFFDGEVVLNGERKEFDKEIKSIYAGVDVETLFRVQKYSIEHIIPKSFIRTYLSKKDAPSRIKRGATTNVFNFAPAHRDINSFRSSWPFDYENDRIKRNFEIYIEHDYTEYGLDYETEWVVPSKTRGDVARAILYMSLIYGIDEFYGRHLSVLIRWAKHDIPTFWEIKFNEWVKIKHGINNPFILNPINPDGLPYSSLLDDEELLSSLKLSQRGTIVDAKDSADSTSEIFTENISVGDIRIVAAIVNPQGEDKGNEKVSVINTTTELIVLDGCIIKDKMNRRYIVKSMDLNPGETKQLVLSDSEIILSNKEGSISLWSRDENLRIDHVEYTRQDLPPSGSSIVF